MNISSITDAIPGYFAGLMFIGFLLLFLWIYLWMCHVLAAFARSRGGTYSVWMILSFVITPLFAPSVYFYANSNSNYFVRIFQSTLMGIGFSFFYIPYAMFASLLSRAVAKK